MNYIYKTLWSFSFYISYDIHSFIHSFILPLTTSEYKYNTLELSKCKRKENSRYLLVPNVKGEVKRAIKATFAHLCTTLTRDKCLPLLAVKGESSGDKGRFCHAFNPYLWRASKVYFISICTPIKGVVKYVWDSGQRCDKSAAKLCLWLKSKACEKCRQMCLSLRSNVWQSCRQMRLRFKSKV